QVIAEGVETSDECKALRDLGISLMQGYLFSKPLFETCSHADSLAWPNGL
ncbi:MAG: EAL domain-containing protein, partial [Gammaproteobacteria bacterium]|nr:EAL domain-containing protein [Gammaproteobacteria bacterium]